MVWYQNNLNRRERALELSFDIKKLQHSGREKLIPAERVQQRRRVMELVGDTLRANGTQSFPDLQRQFSTGLTAQERMLYERLVKRLSAVDETVEPTLEVFTIILMFSGSVNKALDVHETLRIGHAIATMKDYAKSFVILFKFGLQAGKAVLASSAQSAKLVNDIIQDDEKLIKYASRAGRLLKHVAQRGLDPDQSIALLSEAANEEEQKDKLRAAIHDLYPRRLVSLFFERLCDAIMLLDGLLLEYMTHLTEGRQTHADETANLMLKAMMNAWRNIDTATSVNMMAGNDSRRNAWMEDDPNPPDAVRLSDEMKAQIGISATQSNAGYDIGAIANLYSAMGYGGADADAEPNTGYDAQAELQDIDRIFVKFLPYPT